MKKTTVMMIVLSFFVGVCFGCQNSNVDVEASTSDFSLTTTEASVNSTVESFADDETEATKEISVTEVRRYEQTDSYSDFQNTPTDGESNIASVEIKVLSNKLTVFETPGYGSNVLYKITDHRTITIVEKKVILVGIQQRVWGRLDTGGWIRIDDAYDTDEDITEVNTTYERETQRDEEIADITESTTVKADNKLSGTFIHQDGGQHIYGCGTKHTENINGLVFDWYDRYENHSSDNTKIYSYAEINTLRVTNESWGVGKTTYKIYFDVTVSTGNTAYIYVKTYDKDNYLKSDRMIFNMDNTFRERMKKDGYFPDVVPYGESTSDYHSVLYVRV